MFNFAAIARLRRGVTPKRAIAEVDPLEAQAWKGDSSGAHLQIDLTPLKMSIVGPAQQKLWMLISGAGLVLLLVCVNLAGLLIAKAAARTHEISVRTALGASRVDIVRQFLIEGLLLSVTGGLLGIAAAYVGIHALVASAPIEIPRLASIRMDARALWFTAAISIGAGIVFSLLPALRLSVQGGLKTAGPTSTSSRSISRIHQALAASEIALCTVLLISALLIAQSFLRVLQVNRWANVSRVITLTFGVPDNRYQTDSKRQQLYTRILEAASNYSGVEAAGLVSALPFTG
jgi:cell division protein FtsX